MTLFLIGVVGLAISLLLGCQANKSRSGKWSFFEPRSDTIPGILKPSERVAMIRLKGENGQKSSDPALKKELLEQLLEEYVNSPDAIVRQEVVTASAKISASSESSQSDLHLSKGFDLVKHAAMRDEDPFVRREACRVIASWEKPDSAVVLRHVARNDTDKDVQLQAAQSLAAFGDDRDNRETLGSLLDHRQPALRYQAMQSLKVCTKQDYGNDVHRWEQYLAGEIPDPVQVPSLADRFRVGQLPMIR